MLAPYTVKRLDKDEIEALFDFRQRVFPANEKQMNRERWSWMYQDNPLAGDQPSLWVIKTQDRIVGSMGVLPVPFVVDDEYFQACLGVDYFVEEPFKGLPALQLLKKTIAAYPVLIGSNISNSASRLLLKMGSRDLSYDLYTADVNLSKPGDAAVTKLHGVKAGMRIAESICLKGLGYQTTITDRLPEDYQDLWHSINHAWPCGIHKDATYLRWRYEQCPTLKHYFAVCRRNRRICAMLVVATNTAMPMDEKSGMIVDLFVPQGSSLALMAVLCGGLKFLETQGCHSASLAWNALWARPILRVMGFSLGHSDLGLLVWVAEGAGHLKILQDPERWTFTFGDTDRF